MARTVAIGRQDFEAIIANHCFYVDKTNFIKEWWENEDDVTLITRPRRFGKTLTINMVERFFSIKYKGQGELFKGLDIWKDGKYRELQGTYPVISLSFSDVKEMDCEGAKYRIFQILGELYDKNRFLLEGSFLTERECDYFDRISETMSEHDAVISLRKLCDFMQRYYGRRAIVLLDEYDTPMQEAFVQGYWDELTPFLRGLFNSTFKTNPYLGRGLMTGITRVSKESIFSDLNNLVVITTTSKEYADSFGFTQQEVSDALQEFGLLDKEEAVKEWYDGFTFGSKTDIYNPWSITNFLKKKEFETYWVNTSSNRLVDELIRRGNKKVKLAMEELLKGNIIRKNIDEQIIFSQLNDGNNDDAIWSLLLAGGYLKAEHCQINMKTGKKEYGLKLINEEVKIMFRNMIEGWFGSRAGISYNDFTKALLAGNLPEMNDSMNRITTATFSYFDTGGESSGKAEPERFYHGFVLGLIVDMAEQYEITSNRESGLGRYDVMLKPREPGKGNTPAIIMEFKVHDPKKEKSPEETVKAALTQIKEKKYTSALLAGGVQEEKIREYGFAFEGKNVLIAGGRIQEVEEMLRRERVF